MTNLSQLKQELAGFHATAGGSIVWIYPNDSDRLTVGTGHLLHKHDWPSEGNNRTPPLAEANT